MQKFITVIFPVYNKLSFTKKAVDSILNQNLEAGINLQLVIVNNASDDGETSLYLTNLELELDNVTIITNLENLGFAKACNQAIEYILDSDIFPESDFIITNNDVEFLDGCIMNLHKSAYLDSHTGIVGGKLLFPDGRIQHGGAFLNVLGWGQHIGAGVPGSDSFICNERKEMEYVTGALFYIKSNTVADISNVQDYIGFDEQFSPAYFEEVDYCYMARECGYKVIYEPTAVAIHYENVTGLSIYKDQAKLKKELSDVNQVKFYVKRNEDTYLSYSPYKLLLSCKIYGDWSFSIVMRNLAKGLKHAGVDVSIAPEEYHNVQSMDDWEIKEMILKPNDYWNRAVMRSCEGDHAYLMPPAMTGEKRILHTTGENNVLHKGWISQADHVDLLLTTSTFFKSVLEKYTDTPIEVIPNSIDIEKYNSNITPFSFNSELKSFNFVSIFSYGDRKGAELLIEAFSQEFAPDEDVSLYIHSPNIHIGVHEKYGKDLNVWIRELSGYQKHASILINPSHVRAEIMPHMLKNFQCFVLPTRAEGFGNPILECGALGIPSIVTGYSGVTDFVDSSTGYLIDYDLENIPLQYLPYFRNYIGGQWAKPSVTHLRSLMRYAFENQEDVKTKGVAASIKAKEYDRNLIGAKLKKIIWSEEYE